MAFPPSSQILGAVSVLVTAGKQTVGAFDALGGLFGDLGAFCQRLRPLTDNAMPQELESIVRGLLVTMLDICALATMRTFHVEDRIKLHRIVHKAQARVNEYFKQLLFGQDSGINDRVATLKNLIDQEERMCIALTKKDTTEIKSVTVNIQGLTIDIKNVTYELQADAAEMKFRLAVIQEGQDRIETRIEKVGHDTTESITQAMTFMQSGFEKISLSIGANAAKQSSANSSKAGITKAMQDSTRLQSLLKPSKLNERLYQKALSDSLPGTGQWLLALSLIQEWLDGKIPVLWLVGESGTGKTVLAAQVVERLAARSRASQQDKVRNPVAYYLCSSRSERLDSINELIGTLVSQLAGSDPDYAKYVLDKFNDNIVARPFQGEIRVVGDFDFQQATVEDDSQDEQQGAQSTDATNELSVDDDSKTADVDAARDSSSVTKATPDQKLYEVLLHDYFSLPDKAAFVVADAVDECSVDALTDLLASIQLSTKPRRDQDERPANLHVLLCANESKLAECKLRSDNVFLNAPRIVLDASKNWTDMELFVTDRLRQAWSNTLISRTLVESTRQSILQVSQGNFLLASLLIDELCSIKREDSIRKALLSRLPQDLESAMFFALERLDRELDDEDMGDLNVSVEQTSISWQTGLLD